MRRYRGEWLRWVCAALLVGCGGAAGPSGTRSQAGASGAAAGEPGTTCRELVCVALHELPDGMWVELQNRFPVGVRVTLEFPRLVNLTPSVDVPTTLRVRPQRALRALTLTRQAAGAADVQIALHYTLGTPDARHDGASRYAFPFGGGEARRVSQAPGDARSHSGALAHAWDFDMPVGTPVLAARAGVIVQVRDGFGAGSIDAARLEQANSVIVGHPDGTLANYVHLQAGIPVAVGATLERGERLGLSGASGFASGPHLHFHVWRRGEDGVEQSVPVRFEDADPMGVQPRVGEPVGPGREWVQPVLELETPR